MAHSAFAQPPSASLAPAAATGHRWDGVPLRGKWHVYPERAAAGLWTTPADLGRLALAVRRSATEVDWAFLRQDLARAMLTRQFGSDLGLGFFLGGEGPSLRFSHGGGNEGFCCYLVAYADHPIGAAVMTNADGGWALNQEILQTIAAEYGWPLDASYGSFPKRRAMATPSPIPSERFEDYVGTYELRPDYQIAVAREGSALLAQPTGQDAFLVDPISEATFVARDLNLEIAFQRDDRGVVTGLTLKQDDQERSARKR